jgi:hypothetical protein
MKSKQFSRFERKQGLKHWTSRAHKLAQPVLKQMQICLFHSSSVSRPGFKVTPLILPEVPQIEALSQDSGHTMKGSINKGPNACTPGDFQHYRLKAWPMSTLQACSTVVKLFIKWKQITDL